MQRLRLALLLFAAGAITTATASSFSLCPGQCTCIGDECGDASDVDTVAFVKPGSPNVVPCRDGSDCEDASPLEGPYYEGCWTVADGFPTADLPVSLCAEDLPRRRLRFSNYIDDRCFLVKRGAFWTEDITLANVGAAGANDIFACAAADLAGVAPSRVVLLEIEQVEDVEPELVYASFEIAVRGEAEAWAVQRRLNGPPPPVPPVPVPFVRRRLDADAGKTKADATAAIRACALKEKAPSVWQGALVDLFLVPSRVVQEREIPPDVQGCCCGASLGTIPLPVPVPVPEEEAEEAFEEPPAGP